MLLNSKYWFYSLILFKYKSCEVSTLNNWFFWCYVVRRCTRLRWFYEYKAVLVFAINYLLISTIQTTWIDLILKSCSDFLKSTGLPITLPILAVFKFHLPIKGFRYLSLGALTSTLHNLLDLFLKDLEKSLVIASSGKQLSIRKIF